MFSANQSISDRSYWLNLGKSDLQDALNTETIVAPAKNVILFVGDGMGPTTTTASRIYSRGESGYLSFERFPHVGALKVSARSLRPCTQPQLADVQRRQMGP
jgi:alkaline phosphatase